MSSVASLTDQRGPVLATVTLPNGEQRPVYSQADLDRLTAEEGGQVFTGPSPDGRTYQLGRLRPEVEQYAAWLALAAGVR